MKNREKKNYFQLIFIVFVAVAFVIVSIEISVNCLCCFSIISVNCHYSQTVRLSVHALDCHCYLCRWVSCCAVILDFNYTRALDDWQTDTYSYAQWFSLSDICWYCFSFTWCLKFDFVAVVVFILSFCKFDFEFAIIIVVLCPSCKCKCHLIIISLSVGLTIRLTATLLTHW